jgi:DNA-binding transcriptional LysR family regulator
MAIFAKVVDLNGFTAAARALKVPKAGISRAIAELEAELGLSLMTRTTRRLTLTPAGEQLLPQCRAILETTEQVRQRAAVLSTQHDGALRVLADATYGRVLLAPLVPRFLERYPQIPLEVELGEIGSAATVAGYDLVLRADAFSDAVPPVEGGLGGGTAQPIVRVLGAPPAILCATPAYLQKEGTPETPEDLDRHGLLTPESPTGPLFMLRLSQGARRAELTVRPKLAVNDPALLHSATAAGLGIGLLPEFLCRAGLAAQKLRRVLPDWELPPQAPLRAEYPADLAEDARVRAFVDFLAANVVPALAGRPTG